MDLQGQNGLLSTYREGWRNRSPLGIAMSITLILFYVVLYWEHKIQERFGVAPLTAFSASVGLRNRWYLYGFLYSVAMVAGGIYYLRRHGNSRYNRARITVNVAIQIALGFSLPFIMPLFGSISRSTRSPGRWWRLRFSRCSTASAGTAPGFADAAGSPTRSATLGGI